MLARQRGSLRKLPPWPSASDFVHFQIAVRGYAERICYPVKEGEHRGDVDRFGNLRVGPAQEAETFDVLRRGAIGRLRHLCDVVQ
jgi:hypothetical protein